MEARICKRSPPWARRVLWVSAIGMVSGLLPSIAAADPLSIDRAEWRSDDRVLRVDGNGADGRTVTIRNAGNGAVLATDTVDDEEWERRIRSLTQVPCRVRVEQSNGEILERDVRNRPSNCGPVAGTPTVSISSPAAAVNEGGTLNFTVTRSVAVATPLTVAIGTGGTASAGSDYNAIGASVTIPANATSATVSVATINDTATENAETVVLSVAAGTGYTVGTQGSATGTINASDQPVTPTVSITGPAAAVNEGGTLSYTVTRSATSASALTVNFTASGTATATDYNAFGTSVTIPANTTSATVNVVTANDTAAETAETVVLTLAVGTGYTVGTQGSASGTINASDQPVTPTVSITGPVAAVSEGSPLAYTVTRSAASASALTVNLATGNGSATAGSDFTAPATATIAANATSVTVNVTTSDDPTAENAETVVLNVASGNGYTVGAQNSATGTINASDQPVTPTVSITGPAAAVNEGGTLSYTVTRSATSASALTVNFTASGTATATDYNAFGTSVTIPANTTSATVNVVTVNDTAAETAETVVLTLAVGTGYTVGTQGSASGSINASDQPVAENCNPLTNGDHRGCITGEYTGPEVCVGCHEQDARNMHSSVHYQQNGPTDFVTNITGNAGEGPADKPSGVNAVIGINTYCGTHENSPRFTCAGCHVGNGRFPKTTAELNALPSVQQPLELANIDCLMCHQDQYKRFPDWTDPADRFAQVTDSVLRQRFSDLTLENVRLNGTVLEAAPGQSVVRSGYQGIPILDNTQDFRFRPTGAAGSFVPFTGSAALPNSAMTLTTEQAAIGAKRTTRQSCLNCHAGAAGANGAKRGDLSTSNIASTDLTLDRHMATTGSNLTCSACHNVNDAAGNTLHHVRGRGLDLRANDHATRFTCDNAGCHDAATVHNNVASSGLISAARLTRHTNKVACQTCHIPRYGKGTATETARDWQKPHVTQTACNGRGGWLPEETKSSTATPPVALTPTYQWFDGTSQVYYLTESLANTPTKPLPANIATAFGMAANTPAYVMGRPNPNPDNATTRVTGASLAAAKIYPMKEHWGKLARDTASNTLVPHSTFEFFRTGSFCRAVATARGQNPDIVCDLNLAGMDSNGDRIADGAPTGTQVVPVHTYQTINHGVEPQANSLGANSNCGACHSVNGMTGGPARLDLKGQMGYRVRTTIGWTVNSSGTSTCSNSCHSSKSASFTSFHERSQHVSRGCNACHDQITGR